MKIFLSASPLFSPPNAFIVFRLASGEAALAGTSWFSLESDDARVTVAVQKPETGEDWEVPEEFGLNLLPRDFSPVLSSSFPHFANVAPLQDMPELWGRFVFEEIPSLSACPVVLICRQGRSFESWTQHLIAATVTDVFIDGKWEGGFSEEILRENFPFGLPH